MNAPTPSSFHHGEDILHSQSVIMWMRSHLGQAFRIVSALGILGVVAYVFVPGLVFTKSRTAVVTANVITISSPISGQIKTDLPEVGHEMSKDEIITSIENIVADDTNLSLIKIEVDALSDRYEGLKDEYTKLDTLKAELLSSFENYKENIIKNIEIQGERENHHCEELKNVLEGARLDLGRKEKLVKNGNVSTSEFDKALIEKNRANEVVKQSETTITLLNQQVKALQDGIFIHPDGRSEVPYQLQRVHEITMKQSDLSSQIFEIKSRIEDKKAHYESEKKRFANLKNRSVTMPTKGVVIRKLLTKGNQVAENQPIMDIIDCSHVYIDVSMSQGYFEKITPGQKVHVKLVGSEKSIEGTIIGLRGGALQADKSTNYIGLAMVDKNLDMQVFIAIDEGDLKKIKGDFCHVGRHATVTF